MHDNEHDDEHDNEHDDDSANLIEVYAGEGPVGPVFEELPARFITDNTYELLASPGVAMDLAKGDIVDISGGAAPATVLKRGGNFCVQIYASDFDDATLAALESRLHDELGGTLDGNDEGNLAFSVPASHGFERIDRFFDELKETAGVQWYYANIYKNIDDPADETLLDWWNDGH